MINKKKALRNKHIWFSVWNAKTADLSPKCAAPDHPVRISNK